jgi:hypothetical protein
MQRRRWLMTLLSCACPAGFVRAQDSTFTKDVLAQSLQQLRPLLGNPRLVGEHRLTYWGFEVYHARLWASNATFSPLDWATQRLVLELRYLRDFQGREIAQRSIDEIQSQRPLSAEQASTWRQSLLALLPNVRKGEILTGAYLPDSGAQFWHQGQALGEIRDTEFARRFFGIWLSPQSSQPVLRQQLLAGAAL